VLIPFGDATALAQQITRLLENEDLRRSMGQGGQVFAQSYDGDKLWPRYAEEFERLARR
jgi:glycosyltransferase involved in cell wall biosynthesis